MEKFGSRSLIRDDNYNKSKDPLFIGGGFSWPARSYNCSFCKREFRSAQALGGHMNVHRRDRARLRQSPPWDSPISSNPNPNPSSISTNSTYLLPNLNFSPSSETRVVSPQVTYTFISPEPFQSICDVDELKSSAREVKALLKVKKMKGFDMEEQKEEEFVRVDLGIGVSEDVEKELDLELRLGYT